MAGHEVADEFSQNNLSSSKEEAFASEKAGLLEESLLTAGNPAIICACSVTGGGCRKTQGSISISQNKNQIRKYIKLI